MDRSRHFVIFLIIFISATLCADLSAQVRGVNDYGAIGFAKSLIHLNTTASVMMIGAHPDDEDSALLAYLARGENARTAYLSLTRGDGGQNIIGPELFEPLGIIRTEELLQARRLDGAEQYFTRAFDYGFSKSLDEAKSKWPQDEVMCDAVRAIRMFRPLVVISRFTGTPADGHGHHQYAGFISPLAVAAAGDGTKCKEAGEPWTVLKFYIEQGFSATEKASLQLDTGKYDPLYGRSYFEIAMEGRSQHKSQGEGRLELKGQIFSGFRLAESKVAKVDKETSLFDGIDTSISGAALTLVTRPDDLSKLIRDKLIGLNTQFADIRNAYRPFDIAASIPKLVAAKKSIEELNTSYKLEMQRRFDKGKPIDAGLSFAISDKWKEIDQLVQIAAGIQIDALADRETVVSGEKLPISVRTYYPPRTDLKVKEVRLKATCPPVDTSGCKNVTFSKSQTEAPTPGAFRTEKAQNVETFTADTGKVKPTEPYWLVSKRRSDLFEWMTLDPGAPFDRPLILADVVVEIDGKEFTFEQPVQYRYADLTRGEMRRDVAVVPKMSVELDHDLIVVDQSKKSQIRRIVMSVVNNSSQSISGQIALGFPSNSNISVMPRSAPYALAKNGEKASIAFDITILPGIEPGVYEFGDIVDRQTMNVIAYPHIQTHRYYTSAAATLKVLDLRSTPANIGYIMGSGDEVPEAIQQIGMAVTMLEEKDLVAGDLAKFDSIVVGVRASETRPDMMANKARLLDYAKNGGNLIVQYQRGGFANSGLPPFPVTTNETQKTAAGAIARVTDENATVTIIEGSHPFFTTPNKITDKDFDGWVQERNAYNLVTFDPQYKPLLESHDAGEQPNNGGLVTTKIGNGTWTYCSYSFFRQLPAGVPGAYRLFANILSQPRHHPGKK